MRELERLTYWIDRAFDSVPILEPLLRSLRTVGASAEDCEAALGYLVIGNHEAKGQAMHRTGGGIFSRLSTAERAKAKCHYVRKLEAPKKKYPDLFSN